MLRQFRVTELSMRAFSKTKAFLQFNIYGLKNTSPFDSRSRSFVLNRFWLSPLLTTYRMSWIKVGSGEHHLGKMCFFGQKIAFPRFNLMFAKFYIVHALLDFCPSDRSSRSRAVKSVPRKLKSPPKTGSDYGRSGWRTGLIALSLSILCSALERRRLAPSAETEAPNNDAPFKQSFALFPSTCGEAVRSVWKLSKASIGPQSLNYSGSDRRERTVRSVLMGQSVLFYHYRLYISQALPLTVTVQGQEKSVTVVGVCQSIQILLL